MNNFKLKFLQNNKNKLPVQILPHRLFQYCYFLAYFCDIAIFHHSFFNFKNKIKTQSGKRFREKKNQNFTIS